MISCQELADALYAFVEGELSDDRQTTLRTHLAICPPCAALVESYRLTISLGRRLPPLALPDDCARRLRAALDTRLGRQAE